MLKISRALNATQATAYHSKEFTNTEQAYFSQGRKLQGEWLGRLAHEWGLQGKVTEEQFMRVANGQHPATGEQLVHHCPPFEYRSHSGKIIKSMGHRAGWDATFAAPKTVSLTALVGGDERVGQAHRESVAIALSELERFVEPNMSRTRPVQITGKWIAAKFEHDSSRPVEGYAAPHLHTHVVFFNLTETEDGKTYGIRERELFKSVRYATAIYHAELGYRIRQIGYQLEMNKTGTPEIKGYTQEYIEASSPRSRQIRDYLEARGLKGARAAQLAAYRTRGEKSPHSADEMLEQHRCLAARFGNQPYRVVEEARTRGNKSNRVCVDAAQRQAQEAVTYSRECNTEGEAVADERDLLRDALKYVTGYSTFQDVRENLERRLRSGELLEVHQERDSFVARALTTCEMLHYERDNILQGEQRKDKCESLVQARQQQKFADLSVAKQHEGEETIGDRHIANAEETPLRTTVRDATKQEGYQVEGLAPTAHATQQLSDARIHWKAALPFFPAQDDQSSQNINENRIHGELNSRGTLKEQEHKLTIPARQDLDRLWAWQYELGDSLASELSRETSKSSALEADEDVKEQSSDRKHEPTKEQVRGRKDLQQEYSLDL